MIICFTGTGNSRIVADRLQEKLGDEILRLPPGLMSDPSRAKINVPDGRIIWVFPVHGWNMPHVARKVLLESTFVTHGEVLNYMVCTCGDDIGYTDREWRRLVQKRGWKDLAAFSVQMPNTYIAIRGFDVDAPEVVQSKLEAMPGRVDAIADFIDGHPTDVHTDVVHGSWPGVKTSVMYHLFRKFFFDHRKFCVIDACTGCGRCARNCPIQNITIQNGRPLWHRDCIMCLRCYHLCQHHAIRYGSQGDGKGQYLAPGYILNS